MCYNCLSIELNLKQFKNVFSIWHKITFVFLFLQLVPAIYRVASTSCKREFCTQKRKRRVLQ